MEQQAQEILDVVFRGILTESEQARMEGGGAPKIADSHRVDVKAQVAGR